MTPSFVTTSVKMHGHCLNSPSLATIGRRIGTWTTRTTTLSSVSRTGGVAFILSPPEINFEWHFVERLGRPYRYRHLVVYRCQSLNLHPLTRLHNDLD